MADEIDLAMARANEELESLLAAHKDRPKNPEPTHTGRCHYCEATVPEPLIYCDDECCADHKEELEKLEHLRMVNGGAIRSTYKN